MILAALALSAAPLAAATPQQAVAAIFAPYRRVQIDEAAWGAPWDRPIFTPRLRALIARWSAVTPPDEVDTLSDFDWLCQCQDWDARVFRASVVSQHRLGPDRIEVRVAIRIAPGASRQARLVLQRQDRRWLIDEMTTPDFKRGLRAAIGDTITADIALRKPQK